MATIVGLRCRDGVVLAGDRVLVRDGRIESRNRRHVFDFDDVGAAAVGSDVDRFADRLAGELRSYRLDRGSVSVAVLERLASELASGTGMEAVVAGRDRDDEGERENGTGRAALRGVYADGSTLGDPPMALGSGASLALGQLEAADLDSMSVAEAETFVHDLFETVAERDPGTGAETDVWTLSDTTSEGTSGAETDTTGS
ncbi:20S proteasome subunit A/B [Salinigranum salinum]|uniref:20S proteasome subunit A/B n=1 Tax=Salinigranum salinum TaxID=1364937 RepID=UPI0012605AE7|nr:20S proteasome subunit A/B [Salinigranum salinum]